MEDRARPTDDVDGEVALVLTTEETPERAGRLARRMLDDGAAACVTMHGIRSVYRWDDAVVDSSEVQLVVKTTVDGVPGVRAVIADHHGYDLPEVIVLDAAASHRYAQWVADEVR